MKRREEQVAIPGQLRARLRRPPDLRCARKEDEDVAAARHRQTADRGSDLMLEAALVRLVQVLDLDGEPAACASDHGGAQVPGERGGLERGGHHHELDPGEQSLREREGKVARKMALVELVEDERADAAQLRVGEHAPRENAFGDVPEPGSRRPRLLEAHLPADHIGIAELLRDAPGSHARRDPPRLEHDDLAPDLIEQRRRNAGGLAGARRRLEHDRRVRPQRTQQLRQHCIDG